MQMQPDQTGFLNEAAGATRPERAVLEVNGLKTYFFTRSGAVKAVDDISFSLKRGETLAIVGESGCGKSVTALSLMRLVPDPPGRIVGGAIRLEDTDILALDDDALRALRGRDISMVFQEPMTSLNPVMTIGRQLGEVLQLHETLTRSQLRAKVVELLSLVRIPDAARRAKGLDRGRADHRARRHRAGADPRTDRRPAEQARHRGDPDHP
jgi:peptide/nickel transport system ATP-binding protein